MVATAKFLVEATKNSFVVPYFVAVTKPFFSVYILPKSSFRIRIFVARNCIWAEDQNCLFVGGAAASEVIAGAWALFGKAPSVKTKLLAV